MAVNTRLSKADTYTSTSEEEYMSKVPQREVVGALLWCSLKGRPDLSRCQSRGSTTYFADAYQDKDRGILYQGPVDHTLVYDPVINVGSWTDSNFSTDPDYISVGDW